MFVLEHQRWIPAENLDTYTMYGAEICMLAVGQTDTYHLVDNSLKAAYTSRWEKLQSPSQSFANFLFSLSERPQLVILARNMTELQDLLEVSFYKTSLYLLSPASLTSPPFSKNTPSSPATPTC